MDSKFDDLIEIIGNTLSEEVPEVPVLRPVGYNHKQLAGVFNTLAGIVKSNRTVLLKMLEILQEENSVNQAADGILNDLGEMAMETKPKKTKKRKEATE
jgi:hypothetical protein